RAPLSLHDALPISAECSAVGDMRFVCGQEAPEDLVVLPGEEWVVASAYAGGGGVRLIRIEDGMSFTAYPAATAEERLDADTYPDRSEERRVGKECRAPWTPAL